MYKRLEVNMPELKALSEADKDAIARELGAIANVQGLYIQTCGTNGDYSKYCYANKSPKKAIQNYKYHDFTSPLILWHLNDTDILQQSAQKSFIQGK
ncbi:hypothetical protein CDQ72_04615 [Campylobacter hyointestinalis subsp. hyointestinalis]|nr:hypothetical protein CDQ67_06480 [Campylobacter hyointestinalis subsp. hyointestinalis]PPB61463.1 hypothetical protein CDQ72_04615 [Campylobacter hyointestinalis subsp. hyointestinalis]